MACSTFHIRVFLEQFHVDHLLVLLDSRNKLFFSAFDVARILKKDYPYDWIMQHTTHRYGDLIAPAFDIFRQDHLMIDAYVLVATVLRQECTLVNGARYLLKLLQGNEKVIDVTPEQSLEYYLRSCQCAQFHGVYFSSWLDRLKTSGPYSRNVLSPPVATTTAATTAADPAATPATVHYLPNFKIRIFLEEQEVYYMMGILDEQHAVYLSAEDVARIMKIKEPCAWAARQTKIIYGDLIAPAVDCVRQKCPMIEATHLMEKVLKPTCRMNKGSNILLKLLQEQRKVTYVKVSSEGEHLLRACRCADFYGRRLTSWFDQLKKA